MNMQHMKVDHTVKIGTGRPGGYMVARLGKVKNEDVCLVEAPGHSRRWAGHAMRYLVGEGFYEQSQNVTVLIKKREG